MGSADARFTGTIPTLYNDYLAPLLFAPYAEDMANLLRDIREGAILETAAGTGVLTRALASVRSPGVRIVATDLNETMLECAKSRTSDASVTWQRADAQRLPFEDRTFDAVVCQFGMMFLPDRDAGMREARRVLKPRGRFLFSVWDRIEANEASKIVSDAVIREFPDDPPRFFERTPFGYHDPAQIKRDVERAGFRDVVIETVGCTTIGYAEPAAIGLCQGTPLRNEIEARDPSRLHEVTTRATHALTTRFSRGPFDNVMSALVVCAFA